MKKIIAGFMAALMAVMTAVSPVLATSLKDIPAALGVPGTDVFVIIGAKAASSDVVGAVDIASRLAEQSYREVTVPATVGVSVTGGVSLFTWAIISTR